MTDNEASGAFVVSKARLLNLVSIRRGLSVEGALSRRIEWKVLRHTELRWESGSRLELRFRDYASTANRKY